MTREEIIKLNKDRLGLKLKKLKDISYEGQSDLLKKAKFYHNDALVEFRDIDFTEDLIFVSQVDLLSVISYVGLLRLNKVDLNDTTLTGVRSRVSTEYMIITANDAKMAYVSYDLNEFDPEGWFLENYSKKDLVLWNLPKILGSGTERDSNTIMNSINSIYEMRRFNNKLNWMFFIGTEQEFNSLYRLSIKSKVYVVETTPLINKSKGGNIF